jgi:hypothetical protein
MMVAEVSRRDTDAAWGWIPYVEGLHYVAQWWAARRVEVLRCGGDARGNVL